MEIHEEIIREGESEQTSLTAGPMDTLPTSSEMLAIADEGSTEVGPYTLTQLQTALPTRSQMQAADLAEEEKGKYTLCSTTSW